MLFCIIIPYLTGKATSQSKMSFSCHAGLLLWAADYFTSQQNCKRFFKEEFIA